MKTRKLYVTPTGDFMDVTTANVAKLTSQSNPAEIHKITCRPDPSNPITAIHVSIDMVIKV